jgi:hypothetical protein
MKTVVATLALVLSVLTFVAWDAPAQNQSPMGNSNSTPHAAPTAYEESASSCSTDGMKTWRACHICQTGRWYDIKEYECTAEEEARQERARARR